MRLLSLASGAALLPWLSAGAALWLVLLYLWRQPKFHARIPYAPLWRGVLKSHRPRRSLKTWLSLLLQLLLLVLLVLALARPESGDAEPGRNIVVLLDASASMQARDVPDAASGPPLSRFGVAVRRLERWLLGLRARDAVLLVRLGPQALPVAGFTSDRQELLSQLSRLEPGDSFASLLAGLRLARASLQGRSRPEIVLASDGAALTSTLSGLDASALAGLLVELSEVPIAWLPTGGGGHNVAITQLSVRRYPASRGRFAVQLELENFGSQPCELELSLFASEQPLVTRSLRLKPRERRSIFESGLKASGRVLRARLVAPPASNVLAVDDRAWALLPESQPLEVLLVSRDNRYLEAALLLDASISVTALEPTDPMPEGPFDVAVYDGVVAHSSDQARAALYLNPPQGGPVKLGRRIRDFGFDRIEAGHPIWQHIAPKDVQVLRGNVLRPGPGDFVLGASVLGPLLVSGERAGQRFLALGFDPRESDFVLRVAWPLFMLNALSALAPQLGDAQRALSTVRLGAVSLGERLAAAPSLWWHAPAQPPQAVAAHAGKLEFWSEQVGLHAITGSARAVAPRPAASQRAEVRWVAANLTSAAESRIEPPAELQLGDRALSGAVEPVPPRSDDVWVWLVGAWLLLASIEWWTFHRRVTV